MTTARGEERREGTSEDPGCTPFYKILAGIQQWQVRIVFITMNHMDFVVFLQLDNRNNVKPPFSDHIKHMKALNAHS